MGYINKIQIDSNSTHLIEPTLFAITSGTASAYTATITDFELVAGTAIYLQIHNNNEREATLNINNLGMRDIYYKNKKVIANQLKKDYLYVLIYDGAKWQLVGDTSGIWEGNATTSTGWESPQVVYVNLNNSSTATTIQGGSDLAQVIGVDGILKVNNGGTGVSSFTLNKLIYSDTLTTLTSSGHYIDDEKIAINSANEPTDTLYVNGSTKLGVLTVSGSSDSIVETTGNLTISSGQNKKISINANTDLFFNSDNGDNFIFCKGGASVNNAVIRLDSGNIFRPEANGGSSLGSDTYKWLDIYGTNIYGSLTGNASSATTLQNARLLWGNSFDGSANVNETISLGDEARVDARINRKKEDGAGWAFSPIRILDNADSDFAHFGVYGHANSLDYIYIGANNYSGNNLRITSDGEVRIPVTTTASSKTTGALTVGGGAGFGGTVYANEFNGPLNGEAATVRRATFGDASNGEHNADNITSNGLYYYTSNGPSTTGNQFNTSEGALYCQAYNTNWVGQIAQDYRNGALAIRGKKNGTWQNWLSIPTMITETYPTLLPSNGTNNWIKIGTANTSYGILPSQTGGIGSGHNYLGASTWYWSQSYIDSMYTNRVIFNGDSCRISYTGTKNTYTMIQFIDNTSDTYGNGIAIGGGGQTIIGGGESTSTLVGQTSTNGAEIMWIGNDGDIELFPGQGNGFNNAYKTTINSSGITVGVEGNTTKETVFKVSSGAGSIGLYSSSSTTGNRGLWAYPHGTATSGKNIITLDTDNNINYASGTAGNLYMASGSGVVNSSGGPTLYFLRGNDLAILNRMGSIFCNYGTTNNITRCDRIYLRQFSYNSSTGAAINQWDQYCLPAVTSNLTSNHTYDILTTKDMSFSITGNAATATLATKATGDSDGNTINTTYAKLSGAAFTGNITITKAGKAYVYSKNSSTGNTVYLDSGSGTSHGIWSSGYYNGSSYTSSGKWLIYRNDTGNVIVNGDCTGNAETATKDSAGNVISSTYLKLSGGTMSGHIYLGGSNASSSTANTTQIVFGTSSNQHLAVSSNSKALVLNPTTSSTTSQIVLALEQASTIPYGINTSQQSTMNRTNIGKFIDFCQNGSTCGCLRLQTLGTTTAEGYADLLLGNTTKSNADKNATGRVYLANSNGGWLEIKAMYGTLAGATRSYININNWLNVSGVTGAVWNDYAEFRKTNKEVKAGQVVIDNDDGSLSITNKRLMPGAQIVSDTFGFSIGETEEAKTPLAVSGRVLVYTYRPREEYHAGMAVCSAPNGTIDIMTREEIQQYPDAIIGIVSEIPEYEEWGTGKVKVNGRIWIKIK